MTLEGIFGVPLDVTATYIILFTIYGAVSAVFGSRYVSFWTGRWRRWADPRAAPVPGGRVTLAGFLLGTVSGSGVATTRDVGFRRVAAACGELGYPPDVAGAILSAAGIGAILSPPTLGAAAFLIAEFLQISYLQVLVMATIPTLLYYLSIFLMIEADSRRLGTRPAATTTESVWRFDAEVRLPLHVALRDRGADGGRLHGVSRGVLGDRCSRSRSASCVAKRRSCSHRLLHALETGAHGVLAVGCHDRHRRHHRRRRHADRAWAQDRRESS